MRSAKGKSKSPSPLTVVSGAHNQRPAAPDAGTIPVLYCLHDDYWFLAASMRSFKKAGPIFAFVSRVAWDGSDGCWERVADIAREEGAEVIIGDWPDESSHRKFAQQYLRDLGYSYCFIPDGDEVADEPLLDSLIAIARDGLAEQVMASMATYWKALYVIQPPERLTPVILIDLQKVQHRHIRVYEGGRQLILGPEFQRLHHLSYVGPDERITRKMMTSSHRTEWVENWASQVWRAWDNDKLMRNLHPTHPPAYGYAERLAIIPEVLKDVDFGMELAGDPEVPAHWPEVSIVIPLFGGEEDITALMGSLKEITGGSCAGCVTQTYLTPEEDPRTAAKTPTSPSTDPGAAPTADLLPGDSPALPLRCPPERGAHPLIHEIVIVNDCSPDNAAEAALKASFPGVKIIHNKENLGFPATCNRGYAKMTGDVVIFLNSDTLLTRAGLIRLVECLMSSPHIGAAGPYSNSVGYQQQTPSTYTDPRNLVSFTQDFANRDAEDIEVSMLVGFCLAVKRSVLEEVGLFDEIYGRGFFEDNDLVLRILMAGYKCVVAGRSFVHHGGSKSMARIEESPNALLTRNMEIYHRKWAELVLCGYISHLPGQKAEPIVFRPEMHPDAIRKRIRKLARKANITVTIIVKDRERELEACLRSIEGMWTQLVVIDTGSTDGTKEVALRYGAELYERPWDDSFCNARNEAMKYVKGDWIFWVDSDDTVPLSSVEQVLLAAINAKKDVTHFIMPVQFVENGAYGTRVDHCKLFRNLPGLVWDGHIHEQIIPSLAKHGGRRGRINGLVLHSSYDNTPDGQIAKRQRDEPILMKDIAEKPNHPFRRYNLGMSYFFWGEPKLAEEWLERSIEVSKPDESHLRSAYCLLGRAKRELGDEAAALATFEKGLAVVGEDPDLHFQMGMSLTALGRLAEAKRQYLAIEPDTSGFYSSIDVGILTTKRWFNIAGLCIQMGDYLEAKEWFRKGIEANFIPSADALFREAMARHDFVAAEEAFGAVRKIEGPSELWALLGAQLAPAQGRNPFDFLEESVREHSHATGPRMVFCRHLLNVGYTLAAEPHLVILDECGIGEAAFFRGVNAARDGDLEAAIKHTKRALELDPNSEQVKTQLAELEKALEAQRSGRYLA